MNIHLLDWQTVVALLIVLVAIIFLARKTWKTIFHPTKTGCGTSCGSCPSASQSNGSVKVTKLIQLDSNSRDH